MGLAGSEIDESAIRVLLESDSPSFSRWQSSFNQRLQLYLGGVDGLATSNLAPDSLSVHRIKIRELREMIARQPRSWPRQPRTLSAVVRAVDSGSLQGFWTGEADSDLWVVLKTLQEHLEDPAAAESLIKLVDWVAAKVQNDLSPVNTQISDRRHAWWAIRTLYQARAQGMLMDPDGLLSQYLQKLLAEPVYAVSPIAISSSLVPEFHDRIAVGWELVNVSELLRGPWCSAVEAADLIVLHDREEALTYDILDDNVPTDMRVATVYARAALTLLTDECPVLWGKDV